jgi:hypothetical protein
VCGVLGCIILATAALVQHSDLLPPKSLVMASCAVEWLLTNAMISGALELDVASAARQKEQHLMAEEERSQNECISSLKREMREKGAPKVCIKGLAHIRVCEFRQSSCFDVPDPDKFLDSCLLRSSSTCSVAVGPHGMETSVALQMRS